MDKPEKSDQRKLDNFIWRWFGCDYKVHCSDPETYKRMIRWKKSRPGGKYLLPDGSREYDVIIPEDYFDRVVRLLYGKTQSTPRIVDTKPVLQDKDLAEVESLWEAMDVPNE
ncbi:MAG: hypothetical protein IID63_06775 [candidate division Zixibacteria bacterium]|nr:hypothetical protein [candidate division Zixibacteria bacterium]